MGGLRLNLSLIVKSGRDASEAGVRIHSSFCMFMPSMFEAEYEPNRGYSANGFEESTIAYIKFLGKVSPSYAKLFQMRIEVS